MEEGGRKKKEKGEGCVMDAPDVMSGSAESVLGR